MKKRIKPVYVTRDSGTRLVRIWPEDVGIRKFKGCTVYGAAWSKDYIR